MSFESYKGDPNFLRLVESKRNAYGEAPHSPVRAFAKIMIGDAQSALIANNRGFNSPMSSTLTHENPNHKSLISTGDLEARVFMGNALISIEDIIASGSYDHYAFISRINLTLGSYGGAKLIADPNIPAEELPDQHLKQIGQMAQHDPSLGIFFEKLNTLPRKLANTLAGKKNTLDKLIPEYTDMAHDILVPLNQNTIHKSESYKRMTLKTHDEKIQQLTANIDQELFLREVNKM